VYKDQIASVEEDMKKAEKSYKDMENKKKLRDDK
jgi:hypothetical protein